MHKPTSIVCRRKTKVYVLAELADFADFAELAPAKLGIVGNRGRVVTIATGIVIRCNAGGLMPWYPIPVVLVSLTKRAETLERYRKGTGKMRDSREAIACVPIFFA